MVNRFSRFLDISTQYLCSLASAVFAGNCIMCGASSKRAVDICQFCENALPWVTVQCPRCALPLLAETHLDGDLCEQCSYFPPLFHQALTVWAYEPPVAQLISAFKFQRRYSYGKVLAEMTARRFEEYYSTQTKPDFFIAIPLHWRRHIIRGFNQSEFICRYLSRHLNIPMYAGVKRIKATPAQRTLDAEERRLNIEGAFYVKPTAALQDSCIAIVDDVMTTGATANELSQCLLNQGASEIHVLCLARTPLD